MPMLKMCWGSNTPVPLYLSQSKLSTITENFLVMTVLGYIFIKKIIKNLLIRPIKNDHLLLYTQYHIYFLIPLQSIH